MRHAIWLVAAVLLVAAGKDKDKDDRWGPFATYKGARRLCQEHVTGSSMEIAWQSYATADAVPQVVAFYEKDQGRKAEGGTAGEFTLHAASRPDDIIAIYPAEKIDAYPGCNEKPNKGERTVIVVATGVAKPK